MHHNGKAVVDTFHVSGRGVMFTFPIPALLCWWNVVAVVKAHVGGCTLLVQACEKAFCKGLLCA